MDKEYDGIMIGGGHNAMVCCGYLAKAGLKMLLVERHLELGGGLDSHETKGGFWHNVHSNNHRGVCDLMWYKDLKLGELGQEYIRLPVSVALLTRDHKALLWYADEPEKTAASLARFSAKDGKSFLEIQKKYSKMAKEVFGPEQYAPPVPFEKKKAILEKSKVGRQYLRWQALSINDAFGEFFENEVVRAMFVFLSVIRGYETDAPGLGFIAPASVASGVATQMAKNTSHSLAHTLHKMLVKADVDLLEGQAVKKIIVEGERAVGVQVADGREFRARNFVASSVNPNMTFLDMVGREHLDPGFAKKVDGFKYSNTTPLFTLHLSLNERTYWKAAEWDPDVNDAWYIITGVDGMNDILEMYEDCAARRLPRGIRLLGGSPAQHDPSQAPPGKCTSYYWQPVPGNLCEEEGGKERWDEIRDAFTERCVQHLAPYTENLTPENIIEQFGQTPLDIERHLPNMVGGDIQVGELSANQILDKRPFPECSQYRTPVKGLYLCGASTHPYGNITGAPGYNAAGVICRDLGKDPWWNTVDVEDYWTSLGEE